MGYLFYFFNLPHGTRRNKKQQAKNKRKIYKQQESWLLLRDISFIANGSPLGTAKDSATVPKSR